MGEAHKNIQHRLAEAEACLLWPRSMRTRGRLSEG